MPDDIVLYGVGDIIPDRKNIESIPEILTPDDRRFGEVVGYIEEISTDQGLETNFTVQGDEVIIVNDEEAKKKVKLTGI